MKIELYNTYQHLEQDSEFMKLYTELYGLSEKSQDIEEYMKQVHNDFEEQYNMAVEKIAECVYKNKYKEPHLEMWFAPHNANPLIYICGAEDIDPLNKDKIIYEMERNPNFSIIISFGIRPAHYMSAVDL